VETREHDSRKTMHHTFVTSANTDVAVLRFRDVFARVHGAGA